MAPSYELHMSFMIKGRHGHCFGIKSFAHALATALDWLNKNKHCLITDLATFYANFFVRFDVTASEFSSS